MYVLACFVSEITTTFTFILTTLSHSWLGFLSGRKDQFAVTSHHTALEGICIHCSDQAY
jgi:hypothetical protein